MRVRVRPRVLLAADRRAATRKRLWLRLGDGGPRHPTRRSALVFGAVVRGLRLQRPSPTTTNASSTTARDVENLIYHSDRGVLSIRYMERLTEAGIESSVGSIGDSYDNALAGETGAIHEGSVERAVTATSFVGAATRWMGHVGGAPPAPDRRFRAYLPSGLSQCTPAKRAKSESSVRTDAPWARAIAAIQASVVRSPPVPAPRRSSDQSRGCSAVS